jgi:hypothetical protein
VTRQPVQLLVNERNEPLERALVSFTPGLQQPRDFVAWELRRTTPARESDSAQVITPVRCFPHARAPPCFRGHNSSRPDKKRYPTLFSWSLRCAVDDSHVIWL